MKSGSIRGRRPSGRPQTSRRARMARDLFAFIRVHSRLVPERRSLLIGQLTEVLGDEGLVFLGRFFAGHIGPIWTFADETFQFGDNLIEFGAAHGAAPSRARSISLLERLGGSFHVFGSFIRAAREIVSNARALTGQPL